MALEGVEKERDYYFSKLREVELLCQDQGEEHAPFVDRLMEVLYAADEQVGLDLDKQLKILLQFSPVKGTIILVGVIVRLKEMRSLVFVCNHMRWPWSILQ